MSIIKFTKCDGPECKNKMDQHTPTAGGHSYWKLELGGNDFEMSSLGRSERYFDFCKIECLEAFIAERWPKNNIE